jgi:murein DD-endopeptidase MepM/ murein hydrolase activator NlpD
LRLPSFAFHRPRSLGIADVRAASAMFSRRAGRLVVGLGHERLVAVAAAAILLSASFMSVGPGRPSGDTGGPSGNGSAPRLAIGGSGDGDDVGSVEEAYVAQSRRADESDADATVPHPDLEPTEIARFVSTDVDAVNRATMAATLAGQPVDVEGPFLDDGTLLKPVAVDTSVPDGSDLLRTYKVKSGDTLATIARSFDVSMMTLWWANKLKSKDKLVVGQQLRIPPVNGLVVEVTPLDTLTSLAARYKVDEQDILTTNGLDDRNLVVGQVLMLPGARGAQIKVPKPKRSASSVSTPSRSRSSGGGTRSVTPPRVYRGGSMAWPTSSRHISQYYHYGHYGIDIDGSSGDPIYAAALGTVIFAGWKNNGGGYQVWIAHGSGLYTTYNHMSSVSVGRGQTVGRGQRVGRMGASGYASGSHLHFEVWKGRIWDGGRRVNPLAYI